MIKHIDDSFKLEHPTAEQSDNNNETQDVESLAFYFNSIENALQKDYSYRFNLVTQKYEYAKTNESYSELDFDRELVNLRRELILNKTLKKKLSITQMIEFITGIATQYNPIQDYFSSLNDTKNELSVYKLATDSLIFHDENRRWVYELLFKRWCISAVACALGRGPNHVMLILLGEQGVYKTTWLNSLIPTELYEFSHLGKIYPEQKDTLDLLAEKFMINIDDQLDYIMRTDFNALKSVITAESVTVRKAYARSSIKRKRIANFVASVNNLNFLNDTQNRRYLCFHVDKCKPLSQELCKTLWATSYELLRNGEQHWLTSDEQALLNELTLDHLEVTKEGELLASTFEPCDPRDTFAVFYDFTRILEELQRRATTMKLNEKVLQREIKRQNFIRLQKRTDTGPRYVYALRTKTGQEDLTPDSIEILKAIPDPF